MLRITIRALRAQQLFKVSEPEYLDKVRDLEMWQTIEAGSSFDTGCLATLN